MDSWACPRAEVADLIRRICQDILADFDAFAETVAAASLDGIDDATVSTDLTLRLEEWQITRADVVQWLTSNINRPGARVEPYVGPAMLEYARDLRRRQLRPDFTAAWQAALKPAWRRWVTESLQRTGDPEVLVELLDLPARSIVQYAFDCVRAIEQAIEQDDPVTVSETQLLATLDRLLRDAPVPLALAESHLGYRLEQQHTAAVVWSGSIGDGTALDRAVAAVLSTAGCRSSLVARASGLARWVWLGTDRPPSLGALRATLGPGPQVAVGSPGFGPTGFRRSHLEATAAQGVLVRLGSSRQTVHFDDVRLVDALTQDPQSAQSFVTGALGDLAAADRTLREAVLAYVQCGFSTSRAAERLFAHRNTVERRVARANELSRTRIEENPTQVAAALMILDLGDP